MDLLFAFEDRQQSGTADGGSLAPISRLLGVDTIWASGDVASSASAAPAPRS